LRKPCIITKNCPDLEHSQSSDFKERNENNRYSCLHFIQNWDIGFGQFLCQVIISYRERLGKFIQYKLFIELFLIVRSENLCGTNISLLIILIYIVMRHHICRFGGYKFLPQTLKMKNSLNRNDLKGAAIKWKN